MITLQNFQTTDPLSKVQEYLQDNPSHAMAIATGLLPEAGMPQLASNQVAGMIMAAPFLKFSISGDLIFFLT